MKCWRPTWQVGDNTHNTRKNTPTPSYEWAIDKDIKLTELHELWPGRGLHSNGRNCAAPQCEWRATFARSGPGWTRHTAAAPAKTAFLLLGQGHMLPATTAVSLTPRISLGLCRRICFGLPFKATSQSKCIPLFQKQLVGPQQSKQNNSSGICQIAPTHTADEPYQMLESPCASIISMFFNGAAFGILKMLEVRTLFTSADRYVEQRSQNLRTHRVT